MDEDFLVLRRKQTKDLFSPWHKGVIDLSTKTMNWDKESSQCSAKN